MRRIYENRIQEIVHSLLREAAEPENNKVEIRISDPADEFGENDYEIWLTKSAVFNLEEWFDIDTLNGNYGGSPIYQKPYNVTVEVYGPQDDDDSFYEYERWEAKIVNDGGFFSDLNAVKASGDNWAYKCFRRAFNELAAENFALNDVTLGTWEFMRA
jgi:hypothetical protein